MLGDVVVEMGIMELRGGSVKYTFEPSAVTARSLSKAERHAIHARGKHGETARPRSPSAAPFSGIANDHAAVGMQKDAERPAAGIR